LIDSSISFWIREHFVKYWIDFKIKKNENNSATKNDVNASVSNCFIPKNIVIPPPIPTLKNKDPFVNDKECCKSKRFFLFGSS